MDWFTMILQIVSAVMTKLIRTPAEKARDNWNEWRRKSDENVKNRDANADTRKSS